MKKINFLVFISFIAFAFSNCGSNKGSVTKPPIDVEPEGSSVTYEVLRIIEKDELSKDGLKIIKRPVLSMIATGSPMDITAEAERSAQNRASNLISNSIKQTLNSKIEEKIAGIGGETVRVFRDYISSLSSNVIGNLKPGQITTIEKSGMFESKAEMYLTGEDYVKESKKAASGLKDKIISDEKIENTKKIIEMVDEIFDGNLSNITSEGA